MTASIIIPGPLKGARVVDRPQRFVVRVALEPEETVVETHLAHPAPLTALMQPEHRIWVRATPDDGRRTDWTAVMVQDEGGSLVSLESDQAHDLISVTLHEGRLSELEDWFLEATNVPLGRSRVDFQLSNYSGEKMLLAVVPVTRSEGGIARFPDAANEHAARHVLDLIDVAQRPGWHACVLFVVQRNDAKAFAPDERADPNFVAALRKARAAGVRAFTRRCQLTLEEAMLGLSIPMKS